MSPYLYLLYEGQGQLAGLTLEAGADDAGAWRQANQLLHDHEGVQRVEVWRNARLVTQAGC